MNLLVQNLNDKFINNIDITRLKNLNVYKKNINNNLYNIHYTNNINSVIFCASLMNNEVRQYIAEFFQNIKIFIYHDDKTHDSLIEEYAGICYHLIQSYDTNTNKPNTIISIPNLVNTDLYNQNTKKSGMDRVHEIVCFLDNTNTIPQKLLSYLYPNSKLKIKLFNNPKIKNAQNIGVISESDKSVILSQTKYFVPLAGNYITEAFFSGCCVLDLDELDSLKPQKYTKQPDFVPYSDFLQLLVNI